MKRFAALFCLIALCCSLCACSAKHTASAADAPQMAAEQTFPTETAVPVTEAAGPVTELLIREHYHFTQFREDAHYALYLRLYPQSSQCTFSIGNQWPLILSAAYTEDSSGLITVSGEKEILRFRRDQAGLVLEEGSLAAYLLNDPYNSDPIVLKPGTVLESSEHAFLRAGTYVLDDSESPVAFDDVLLDLDLTQMCFALKCFDGNVVQGTLEIREGLIYCLFNGGRIAFDIIGLDPDLTLYVCYPEDVGQSYLMYCPQTEFHYAHQFRYSPEHPGIPAPLSGADFLENRKNLAKARYSFTCPVEGVDRTFCYLKLDYCQMTDTWELIRGAEHTRLEATEDPDGTLIFSTGDLQWQFHRENNGLVFDGGSPLEACGELENGIPKYTVPLEPGDYLCPDSFSYLYDTLYTVSDGNGGHKAAVRLDTEFQRLLIACSDGSVLEAPYVYTSAGLQFPMGTHSSRLTYGGHSLYMSNPHNLTIVEGEDDFWLIPTLDADVSAKNFRFQIKVPEREEVPQGSILVYEDYTTVVSYPGMMLHGTLLLCPHDNTFEFNNQFCSFHAQGTYEDADGIITLEHPEGRTTLRRRDRAVEIVGGDSLCLSGMPFTSVFSTRQKLAEGSLIPLYEPGWLFPGTYTFTSDSGTSSITFDTENRTFTMTDAYGRVYAGDIDLDYKFVNCNAPDRSFQFIPKGMEIRLNQSKGEKVVPVENDYIFYRFAD